MLNTQRRAARLTIFVAAAALILILALLFFPGGGRAQAAGELLRYGSRGESVRQVHNQRHGDVVFEHGSE